MRSVPPSGLIFGHPKGLFLLFGTEMWERFSYYGMRALLVLTLVAAVDGPNPGFGMSDSAALHLYGYFTGLVWFSPILGGWLADTYLGQRLAVQIGSLVIAAGQFILAASVPGNLPLFLVGLAVLVLGNGFFKANISTMVGTLYEQGDARRDGGFTIFYMGINIGSFLAPLICSTLGEDPLFGWRYGYMAAGVGMLLAFVLQALLGKSLLGEVGVQPSVKQAAQAGVKHQPLTKEEWDRLRVILTVFIFCVLFWGAYEQQGGLMNLYTETKIDRVLGGFEIPTGWFQSVNPFFIVVLGPVFAALWACLGAKGRDPASPVKMIYGLALTGIGFLFMVGATIEQSAGGGKANMIWLLLALLFHTMGELCISPVGLSMTTKLAPARLASVIMGVWFLTNFVGNILAGYVGAMTEQLGDAAVYGGLTAALAVFAVFLWLVSGRLVTWMHGAETVNG